MAVSFDYVAKETMANLWRNRVMALAAVLTVAVSLSLVGTALLLRQVVNRQIGQWSNNVSLQVFMNANATPQQLNEVKVLISQEPQITSCSYLNHERSYQQARQVLAGEPTALQALTPAITPTVYRCQLQNANDAPAVASIFTGVPGVFQGHAQYPAQSIRTMQKITNILQVVLLAIAIVLLVSSLVLILNAIRMAIFARRREVSVMKLVGATNWFIRIPFMLEGLVQGMIGAIVAAGIVLLSNIGVNYLVRHYLSSSTLPVSQLVVTEVVVVVIGVLVGVIGSTVAVRRFLDV
jgi:cell division transport system permease protein